METTQNRNFKTKKEELRRYNEKIPDTPLLSNLGSERSDVKPPGSIPYCGVIGFFGELSICYSNEECKDCNTYKNRTEYQKTQLNKKYDQIHANDAKN